MRRAVRTGRSAAWAVATVSLAAGMFAWSRCGLPVAPPADVAAADPVAAAAAGPGPDRAAAVPVSRIEAPAGTARLRGRAVAADGSPLAHWSVHLDWPPAAAPAGALRLPGTGRRAERASRHVSTDATGAFAFDDLAAGQYGVCLGHVPQGREVVDLLPGQVLELTLRCPLVVLTVRVVRAGEVVSGCIVRGRGAGGELAAGHDDDHGQITWAVPPGTYRFEVGLPRGQWVGDDLPARSTHEVEVGADRARLVRDFVVFGTDVAFVVHEANGMPAPSFTARIEGRLADGAPAAFATGGTRGLAVVSMLPPGTWRASVVSPAFTPTIVRDLATTAAEARADLEFVVERAGTLQVEVCAGDRALAVVAEQMPLLAAGAHLLPCQYLTASEGRWGAAKLGYRSVPFGSWTLVLDDRQTADEVVFLPFDPLPAVAVAVVEGVTNRVRLQVVPRALLDVRGCDRVGREDFTACVSVFAGPRRVRSRPEAQAQRWSAFVPPGEYRVVVDRNGDVREQYVQVARRDVALRCRP